ncbi:MULTISPECIES: hypothetical protein [unclassified Roseibium]|uniref:hypothetical protein n=1 Tax=unclassified Roseibium TaxID=2629323 RepID=UPI00274029CB|nr:MULTISPECIES: hypothetical protein [unclassified Roseibium]
MSNQIAHAFSDLETGQSPALSANRAAKAALCAIRYAFQDTELTKAKPCEEGLRAYLGFMAACDGRSNTKSRGALNERF